MTQQDLRILDTALCHLYICQTFFEELEKEGDLSDEDFQKCKQALEHISSAFSQF